MTRIPAAILIFLCIFFASCADADYAVGTPASDAAGELYPAWCENNKTTG